MPQAYPLQWPAGYSRSEEKKYSRFKTTFAKARDYTIAEVKRISGDVSPTISSNIPLKKDGYPYANWESMGLFDHGIAVYFTYKGQEKCLCCDTYRYVWENLYAIGRAIYALRQIDRDGVSDFLDRALGEFKAIAGPGEAQSRSCWDVLGMEATKTEYKISARYRQIAKGIHTNIFFSDNDIVAKMTVLNDAYDKAKKYARC